MICPPPHGITLLRVALHDWWQNLQGPRNMESLFDEKGPTTQTSLTKAIFHCPRHERVTDMLTHRNQRAQEKQRGLENCHKIHNNSKNRAIGRVSHQQACKQTQVLVAANPTIETLESQKLRNKDDAFFAKVLNKRPHVQQTALGIPQMHMHRGFNKRSQTNQCTLGTTVVRQEEDVAASQPSMRSLGHEHNSKALDHALGPRPSPVHQTTSWYTHIWWSLIHASNPSR